MGQEFQLTYPKVDDVIKFIFLKGVGCKLSKRDLRRAYHQFWMDPGCVHFLCFAWLAWFWVFLGASRAQMGSLWPLTTEMGPLKEDVVICQFVTYFRTKKTSGRILEFKVSK